MAGRPISLFTIKYFMMLNKQDFILNKSQSASNSYSIVCTLCSLMSREFYNCTLYSSIIVIDNIIWLLKQSQRAR